MPGVDLHITLPSLSDNLAVAIAKIAAALSAIEDDLAGKITPSEMDINTALSMAGNALTSVGSVQLVPGNPSSTPGSVYYNAGEFYMVDATGAVQITSNGSLNAAGLGGIVGDYGGLNPARVSYDDISGEYRFTEDTGIWADLVADDLVINGASGSVRFGVGAGITTARQLIVEALTSSGVSLLAYQASDSSLRDAAVTRATNDTLLTNLDLAGTVKHPDLSSSGCFIYGPHIITVTGTISNGSNWNSGLSTAFQFVAFDVNADGFIPIPITLLANERVKSVTVYFAEATGNVACAVYAGLGAGLGGQLSLIGAHTIQSAITSQTVTIGSPGAIIDGGSLWVRVTMSSGSSSKVTGWKVVYDAVAY